MRTQYNRQYFIARRRRARLILFIKISLLIASLVVFIGGHRALQDYANHEEEIIESDFVIHTDQLKEGSE